MTNQAGAHYRIPAAEAAARLGVKRESLYAYVSRGLLSRRVGEDGRSSLFDLAEVEALVGRRGRRPSSSTIDVTIVSGITRIADDGVWYRGRPLAGLVANSSFEQVAQLLWTGVDELRGVHEVQSDWATHRLLVPPTGGHPADALLQLVIASARGDGTRGALEAAPVTAAGRRMIAAFVDHRPCETPRRPQNRRPSREPAPAPCTTAFPAACQPRWQS